MPIISSEIFWKGGDYFFPFLSSLETSSIIQFLLFVMRFMVAEADIFTHVKKKNVFHIFTHSDFVQLLTATFSGIPA